MANNEKIINFEVCARWSQKDFIQGLQVNKLLLLAFCSTFSNIKEEKCRGELLQTHKDALQRRKAYIANSNWLGGNGKPEWENSWCN